MNIERRFNRSSALGQALDHWFEAIAQRLRINIVMADEQGLLVACNNANLSIERAAASACKKRSLAFNQHVKKIKSKGHTFFLGVTGSSSKLALDEASRGAKRILKEAL